MSTAVKDAVVYGAFVYHDEPAEANTASHYLGMHASVPKAVAVIRQHLGGYWHEGSVHIGQSVKRIDGPHFEPDENATPWQVGADYCERG